MARGGYREIVWVASAKRDLKETPEDVQDQVGYALERVQAGESPECATALHGRLAGVFEIKAHDDDGATYRAVYTTKIGDVVYVLDVFKKKSTHGIATRQNDLDRIEERLQAARKHYERQER